MTHIALIRQQYRPDGGAERFVSRALSALAGQGVELSLITRHWQGDGPFKVITCNPAIFGRISRERGFAEAASTICNEQAFDLVQSHERIPGCSLYRAGDGVHRHWLNLRRETMTPWARWWQEHSRYHKYVLQAEQAMFTDPRLRAVICNSLMVKREIIKYFQVSPEKLHVIYSGVDTELFHPRQKAQRSILREQLAIPQAAHLFLFVGSGFERKNLATTLKALAQLPLDVHLAIVGRDSHGSRYEQLARRLDVHHRCHFFGVRQDLPALYGMADAFVLPTLYDPFPNVILEAMASGLPILTSETCGGAELIRNGAGLVSPARDLTSLVANWRQLCDPSLRQIWGQEARRRVEPLTLSAMSDRLMQLYNQLLLP
ncbi:MAG: glycosyltransferase family 4 protein [Pseudomonadales bacterium]|nr:glycosyltransferase family 4 protein [Pseudomonadales bacterium]